MKKYYITEEQLASLKLVSIDSEAWDILVEIQKHQEILGKEK